MYCGDNPDILSGKQTDCPQHGVTPRSWAEFPRARRHLTATAVALLCVCMLSGLEAAGSGSEAQPGKKGCTLVGRVVDAETGLPIQGIMVVIVGTELAAVTDEHGSYAIRQVTAGKQVVRASGFDYAGVTIWVDFKVSPKAAHANFRLKNTIVQIVKGHPAAPRRVHPGFLLGPRITYFIPYGGMESYDSAGRLLLRTIEKQPYVALGVEAECGPFFRVLRVKTELAHVRFYTHGGLEMLTFPLGADLSIEPPVWWRFRPYAYFGGTLTSGIIGRSSLEDSLTLAVPEEEYVRAGVGFRYALNSRIDVFTEVQLFTKEARNFLENGIADRYVVWGIGIDRLHAGVRIWLRG